MSNVKTSAFNYYDRLFLAVIFLSSHCGLTYLSGFRKRSDSGA